MTPAAQVGSHGSHSIAPTTTSEPRGSLTTAERNRSCSERKRARRSAIAARPRSGPPLITRRVGSPPVCESITRTLRIARMASRSFAAHSSKSFDSTQSPPSRKVKWSDKATDQPRNLLSKLRLQKTLGRILHFMYTISIRQGYLQQPAGAIAHTTEIPYDSCDRPR